MHIAIILASQISHLIIRGQIRASVVTDRLRHGRKTFVKLCDKVKRQCIHLSSLL
jgi:hypothetical protein